MWQKVFFMTAIAGLAALDPPAHAASETAIYSFPQYSLPAPPLMEKPDGTLYGIADNGRIGYIIAFRLAERQGEWKEKELYRFPAEDGAASSLLEHDGLLYGVTDLGGQYGAGAIFSLTRMGGAWTESILYSFTGNKDGSNPSSGLLWNGRAGAFFGVAPANVFAPPNCGTVFSITPEGKEHTLHRFKDGPDGCWPNTSLHELPSGNMLTLVGATGNGGTARGYGTIYLVSASNGGWEESVIYRFANREEGEFPTDLLVDDAGNIFGVTENGGAKDQGLVFELSNGGNGWTEKVLYSFGRDPDGENPFGLCRDGTTGTLYGVTTYGGDYHQGTVFALTPSGGSWTESVLHSFGAAGDGQYPQSRPIYDPQAGALYGTTREGGQFGGGAAYTVSLSGKMRY